MNVLFITQELDQASDVLGITPVWIDALARRVDHVHVLALGVGHVVLPANVSVSSMGKETGAGRAARLKRFYTALVAIVRRQAVDVIFVHMVPLYAILAASVARPLGIPVVLWYTSGGVTARLKLAHSLVQRVVTASPESFRLPSTKVTVTGHGVDTGRFSPGPPLPRSPSPTRGEGALAILAVGRFSRVKDHATLVQAAALLPTSWPNRPFQVKIAGAPFYPDDHAYLAEVRQLAADLGIAGVVDFAGAVPNVALPARYRECDVVVSTSKTGSIDKVVLEGMACGVPVVTSSEAFVAVLGPLAPHLTFPSGDAQALAGRLAWLLALSVAERTALGQVLRSIVVRRHGVDGWADRLVSVLRSLL